MGKTMLQDNLRFLRHIEKLNQSQFAERLGLQKYVVQKWESGVSNPNMGNLLKIKETYRVSIDALLTENLEKNYNANQELFNY